MFLILKDPSAVFLCWLQDTPCPCEHAFIEMALRILFRPWTAAAARARILERSSSEQRERISFAQVSDNPFAPYAAQLNLTQYWGVWGGKYCHSAYDPPPPPGKNNTKAPCPIIKQPPVPAINPVDLPRITALLDGQTVVGGDTPQPIQIKVRLKGTSTSYAT